MWRRPCRIIQNIKKGAEFLPTTCGVDPALINVDMEACNNGYLFHQDGKKPRVQSRHDLYFFGQILEFGKPPQDIIDLNLRTD
jgi:hypothetical protein